MYALGEVSCITIQRSSFVELLGNLQTLREKRKMEDFLNSLSLFGDISLPKAVAQRLVQSAQFEEFKPDEIIVDVNDQPGKFYIIEDGAVKV